MARGASPTRDAHASLGLPARLDVPPASGFVGRASEVDRLLAALGEAASGLRVALVAGDPGAGKTTLAGELARRGRAAGSVVAYGRCDEELGIPFQPWREAVRFLAERWRDRVGPTIDRHAGVLARLIPELHSDPRSVGDDDAYRAELFDAVADVFAAAGDPGAGAAVVVLDDLHAADQATVLLLHHLVATAATSAVLVVATYRPMDVALESPVAHLLATLGRDPAAIRIDLTALAEADVELLVERHLGRPLDGDERGWARQLWRETGGNPFFATSVLGGVGASMHAPLGTALAVPTSVRELVIDRVLAVGADALSVLGTAAVLGEEFDARVLAEVTDGPSGDLARTLDTAAARGLLVALAADGRFRFTHALVARAVAEALGAAQRRAVHARVAAVLEARAGAAPELRGSIARHRLLSGDVGDEGEGRAVVTALLRAGEFATETFAYEDAIEHYQQAFDACGRWDLDGARRAEVLWRLGVALRAAGDPQHAHDRLLEAAQLAADAGRWDLVAEAIGDTPYLPSPTTDDHALVVLEDLRVRLPADDQAARALVLSKIEFARHYSASVEELAELAAEAMHAAEASGDRTAISHATGTLLRALAGSPDVHERLRLADTIVPNPRSGGRYDATDLVQARRARMAALAQLGDMAGFDEELHALVALAARAREHEVEFFALNLQAVRASIAGELGRAEDLAWRATSMAGAVGQSQDGHGILLLSHAFYRGQAGLIADFLGQTASAVPYPMVRCAHAAALAAAGRRVEAVALLDTLTVERCRAVPRDDLWLPSATLLGEACRDLGAQSQAEIVYGELEPYAGQLAVIGGGLFGVLGAVDRTLGITAAVVGDLEAARRHLDAAVTLNAKAGHRPALALSLADRAWLVANAGGSTPAIASAVAEARALAETLGFAGIVERLDRLAVADALTAELRPVGEVWHVRFGDRSITMPALRGLSYLRQLVANAGTEIAAVELQSLAASGETTPSRGPSDPVLDDTAKRAYRQRIADLDEEIEEAERNHDDERATRAVLEREAVIQELARAAGLGGRDRSLDTTGERARLNVSRAIRSAISRIGSQLPALADHLEDAVHTGTLCRYQPDPSSPIGWKT